jgi:diguanylate cyclase (GGDEF)-like protein/PAS domain S-box-containing protein
VEFQDDSPGPQNEFYRAVVALNPSAILAVDVDGLIRFVNERAEKLLDATDLLGRRFDSLFTAGDGHRAAAYVAGLAHAAPLTGMFFAGELVATGGEPPRFVHVHGRNLHSTTEVQGLLLTLIDGTEARRREADLEYRGLYDSLTGLGNRTLLLERMRQVADRDRRAGAVMFVDLDGFKHVNDSLGHLVGDTVLVEIARRLQRASPATATIARLGGDEFAVLLPDTTVDVAGKLADTLCQHIAVPCPGVQHSVTASIGVSDVASVEDSLRQADIGMYAAKAAGRNQVVVYSPEVERSVRTRPHDPNSVAALRAERDRLHTEARTDALTGLANRRALDEHLAGPTDQAPVSVLFVDLDRFGAYNHRHGDLQGDHALQKVAQTLSRTSRDADCVYRKGGEEFVVILPRTDGAAARSAGERVRAAVEALELEHGGADGVPLVTVTIGTATHTDGDLVRALRDAGDAAYASKVEGRRNRVASCGCTTGVD